MAPIFMKTISELGEFGLIDLLARGLRPGKDVLAGIGDDCAVIRYTRGKYLLWTTDLLFAGRHFLDEAKPYQIGWKSLAVSISDIAAMAGLPKYALVFIGLPPNKSLAYAREIYRGISDLAQKYAVQIVGGDTNSFDRLVIGTTVLGWAEKSYLTLRSGARPGDLICVSGPLGRGPKIHLSFLPRVKEARRIKKRFGATAMLDISDGLLGDFRHIAEQSGAGGEIYLADIPTVPGVSKEEALVSGEEFELVFTAAAKKAEAVRQAGFFVVGRVAEKSRGVKVFLPNGRRYRPADAGYDHFRRT